MLLSSKLSVLIAILAVLHLQQAACLSDKETDHISKRSKSDQSHVIELKKEKSDELKHKAEHLKHEAEQLKHEAKKEKSNELKHQAEHLKHEAEELEHEAKRIKEQEKHDRQRMKEQEKHDRQRKKEQEKLERQWKTEHPEHSHPVVLPVLPSPPTNWYPPSQPIYPPYHPSDPPFWNPKPSNWQSRNYCSGTYDELTVDDCQHAFNGLIDYSWVGSSQWISSSNRLKTSRHGDCKASVTCSGDYQFAVSASELYNDMNGRGGAHALLKNCVRHGYSGWSTIQNGCSVSFERSHSPRPQGWW